MYFSCFAVTLSVTVAVAVSTAVSPDGPQKYQLRTVAPVVTQECGGNATRMMIFSTIQQEVMEHLQHIHTGKSLIVMYCTCHSNLAYIIIL